MTIKRVMAPAHTEQELTQTNECKNCDLKSPTEISVPLHPDSDIESARTFNQLLTHHQKPVFEHIFAKY